MSALRAVDFDAWAACPGRPWMIPERLPSDYSPPDLARVKARQVLLEGKNAKVLLIPSPRLDIGVVTAERGAIEVIEAVLIVEYADHAELEVWDSAKALSALMIYGLAAMLKYELLHQFTRVVLERESELRTLTADELYVFGQTVTEAANRALQAREVPERHLTPGNYCPDCPAAAHCPAYARHCALELV